MIFKLLKQMAQTTGAAYMDGYKSGKEKVMRNHLAEIERLQRVLRERDDEIKRLRVMLRKSMGVVDNGTH